MPIVIEHSRIIKILNKILQINLLALTFGPLILFEGYSDEVTLNHESIHCSQYAETLYIGFFFNIHIRLFV